MTVTPGPWPGSPAPPEPLPVDLESEQALLGAILLWPQAHSEVADFLRPEHFGEHVHARIYETMDAAIARGETLSGMTIRAALGDVDLGGMSLSAYLARLAGEATQVKNARRYGQAVWSAWARRALVGTAQDLDRLARVPGADPRKLAADAMLAMEEPARGHEIPERVTIGNAAQAALVAMDQARQAGGKLLGVTFGLPALDRRTQGMQRGELIVIAGRPGMGKTSVSLGMAVRAARAGHGVLVFSLEMSAAALARRAMADIAYGRTSKPIAYFDIRAGRIDQDQDRVLVRAAEELSALPLVIEEAADLTALQMLSRARTIASDMTRKGVSLDLVVVDHMGLLASGRNFRSRVEEVSAVSRALKIMGKQLGCPVMALSQLNRETEKRPIKDRRPQLSDLRDSGSIEQDADVVIGCFREAYYLANSQDETEQAMANEKWRDLELIILKQRDGACFTHRVFCDVESNYIADMEIR